MSPIRTQPRILVVEDEGIVAWDIQRSLNDLGFEVAGVASTAEEATRLTSESRPDLVLMDVHIQGQQDGIAAADILRARFGVAVVYLTAHGDTETIERARRTEPLGYLLKPFKKTELYSAVQIALSRHQLEQQLRARERLLATTLRSIGDAVITTDASGKVTFVNPTAEALTGWSQEEAAGRDLAEVFQLRDERTGAPVVLPLDRILRERTVAHLSYAALVRRDGVLRPVSKSLAPVVDGEVVLGAVLVCRDVGEQRRVQEQLELADRMASLGTLAAGVAHEINNPLAFVTANVSYAVEELKAAPPEQRRGLDDVVSALEEAGDGARRVKKIVSDLKLFSRPPEAGAAEADVQRTADWALEVTTPEWRHRVRVVKHYRPVPPAAIDRTRLGQVLVNLVVNAANAVEAGGADRKEVHVRTFTDLGGRAVVEVEDSGAGMTDEVRSKVFRPYFTTWESGRGTGLGLSICLGIVRAAGGDLEVDSAPGRGSTFRVVLPPAVGSRAPALDHVPPTPLSAHGRVLAIDDEPAVLRALERSLRADHLVTSVSSAQAALELLKAADFDVILCDLSMPGMTGMDFHRALRDVRPAMVERVIFLTGGAFDPELAAFVGEVPNLRVDKPFDPDQLRLDVAEAVARASSLG